MVTLNAWVSQQVKILPRLSRNACGPCDVPAHGRILPSSAFSVFQRDVGGVRGHHVVDDIGVQQILQPLADDLDRAGGHGHSPS